MKEGINEVTEGEKKACTIIENKEQNERQILPHQQLQIIHLKDRNWQKG